jgi:hypothetical protein
MASSNILPKNKRVGRNMAIFLFLKRNLSQTICSFVFGSVAFRQFFVNQKKACLSAKACQQISGAYRGQAFPGIEYHRVFI